MLLRLTRHELRDYADFVPDDPAAASASATATVCPLTSRPASGPRTKCPSRARSPLLPLDHPLAWALLEAAKAARCHPSTIEFNKSAATQAAIRCSREPRAGSKRWLLLSCLPAATLGSDREYLLCAARTDAAWFWTRTPPRLLRLPVALYLCPAASPATGLADILAGCASSVEAHISARTARAILVRGAAKLEGLADDQKLTLERDPQRLDAS
jgi:hypothetical protein